MCHFIWYDNECSDCGLYFDRRLTRCKDINAWGLRLACDKTYIRANQPNFRCQNCTSLETPWRKVAFLVDANEVDYYSDDPNDKDYIDGNSEKNSDSDDKSGSSEDDGDMEFQGDSGNLKRELQSPTGKG
ncbi:hypothetical protein CORC01_11576 [Colletotrichum orchidophilum]|uniref:Uncharacterized protein n=1 Tax=Colletotrichum orchidophilum TaxID=1209926 RepID=A0A1G4AVI9_9PEZI|nr:uncharacterized protein CORC01_11576 [Colletotrichum orchidophilum]OHE93164.1 hypothetical protein CORC01_11576 [Colletotrichum orchidophilum]